MSIVLPNIRNKDLSIEELLITSMNYPCTGKVALMFHGVQKKAMDLDQFVIERKDTVLNDIPD